MWFSGRVQGVGFRYTTRELAEGYAVAGTVRNLDDGRVELVVDGGRSEIDRFVSAIRRRFADNIHDETTDVSAATQPLTGFEILR